MFFFALFYFIVVLTLHTKRLSSLIPIFIMILFASLRGNVGFDTCNYKEFFDQIISGVDIVYLEPGIKILSYFVSYFTNNAQWFLFSFSLGQGILLHLICKRLKNVNLWLIFFLLVFYYPFFFSLLRNGTAVMLAGLAYLMWVKREKFYFIYLLMTPIFHISGVVGFAILKFRYLALILLTFLIYYCGANDFLIIQIDKIFDAINGNYINGNYLSFIFLIINTIGIVVSTRGAIRFWLTFFYVVPAILDIYFGLIGRLSLYPLFIWSIVLADNWKYLLNQSRLFVCLTLGFLAWQQTIYPIIHGDGKILGMYSDNIRTTAGNYHFFYFNDKTLCNY
jgi:hypothetical protein